MNIPSLAKLFKVPLSWCYRQQKLHVEADIKDGKEVMSGLLETLYKCKPHEEWFVRDHITDVKKELDKLVKRKIFLNKMISNHRAEEKGQPVPNPIVSYDIQQIKKIPIDKITEILPSGFFKNNPFRNERSPSNSLHLNRRTNRWCDYASGEFGSNVDLVMVLENCSFKEALKYLSFYV